MSTSMQHSLAQAMISERHHAAARARAVKRHQAAAPSRPVAGRARLAGPIATFVALAMLLLSIPTLSGAPTNDATVPMPSPTPGAAPLIGR